jgi:hypothetical protein
MFCEWCRHAGIENGETRYCSVCKTWYCREHFRRHDEIDNCSHNPTQNEQVEPRVEDTQWQRC